MSKKNIFVILFITCWCGCFFLYPAKSIAETNKNPEWIFYNKTNCGLIEDTINCIAKDKHAFWFGTQKGVSLFYTKKNTLTNYSTNDGLASNYINGILVLDNKVWFGTKKGLTQFNKNKKSWTTYTMKNGLPHNQVNTLLNIGNTLWIGTEIGLTSFNKTTMTMGAVYTTKDGLFDNRIKTLIRDGAHLIIGTVGAVINTLNIDTGKWKIQYPQTTLYSNIVLTAERGFIWCGTNGGGVRGYNKSSQTWKTYTTSNGLCDNFVQAIARDGKNLWVGTFDGISLFNMDTKKWKTFSSKEGISISTILVDGNYVWFGTDNEGIRRYNKQIPQIEINTELSSLTKLEISTPLKIDCFISSYQKMGKPVIEYSTASFPDIWTNTEITVVPAKTKNHYQIIWTMENLPCLSDTYNLRLTVENEQEDYNSSIATIKIDTIPPKITLDSTTASRNIGLQNISGTYNKNKIDNILVQPGNVLATLKPNNQTFTALVNLEEGKNLIRATLTDWLDQTATTKTVMIAKAKSTPGITVEKIPTTKKEEVVTRLTLQETLLFDSGSAQIKKGGEKTIDTIAEFLKRYPPEKHPNLEIVINGHTDNVPIQKCLYSSNLKLSQARAHTVFQSLMKNSSLSAESFSIKGYGKTKPKVSNKTAKGRARNRRVEIIIKTKSGL